MTQATITQIVEAVFGGRLVIIAGAGLSMGEPSRLPSAKEVANDCFDRYATIEPGLSADLRDDLEALATLFFSKGEYEFQHVFIDQLVPWQKFIRQPNEGHAAIADFLICGAAFGALTTNFDTLVETSCRQAGADFRGSLDGDEANAFGDKHSPLLKFHGCENRDRRKTVWCSEQIEKDDAIGERIANSSAWIEVNLREKDWLIVGYWSDWSYLNETLQAALLGVSPNRIFVVDPAPLEELQTKAPQLWELTVGSGENIIHVQDSGSDFLREVRREFSKAYLRKLYRLGLPGFQAKYGATFDESWLEPPDLHNELYYQLRQDAEGQKPALHREPEITAERLALTHLELLNAGAQFEDGTYKIKGYAVRIVNGAGQLLSSVRERFPEAPIPALEADIVVCVGATNAGIPKDVVRIEQASTIVRSGATAEWCEWERAQDVLGL